MDYYRLADDGTLVGRQKDIPRGHTWEPHAVPTDKQGLMDYLNGLNSCQKPAATLDEAAPAIQQPPAPKKAPEPLPVDRAARLIALEEAIQSATGFELSNLIGNVMSRLEEIRREAKLAA